MHWGALREADSLVDRRGDRRFWYEQLGSEIAREWRFAALRRPVCPCRQAGAAPVIGKFFFTKATNHRVLVDSPVFILFVKKLAVQRP